MVNFLDSYIRLKMFNGLTIDVVYYVNCVRYELQGILKKTVGSDYIVCRRNGENIIIPFFGNGSIIKSIKLYSKDFCFNDADAVLFFNPCDLSKIYSTDEDIKIKVFGTEISYENDESKSREEILPYELLSYKSAVY